MRFGCCTGLKNLALLERLGYDYIEPPVTDTLVPLKPVQEFSAAHRAIAKSSIKAEAFNVFLPRELRVTGPKVDMAALSHYVDNAVKRAHALGGKVIVFGSGGSRNVPDGFPRDRAMHQLAEFLKMAGDHAARAGLQIAIEPLSRPDNIILSVAEATALAKTVGKPSVKVLADLYHIGKEGESFESITAAGKDLIHPHVGHPVTRVCPREGEYDYAQWFRALKSAGYDARMSLECKWGDLEKDMAAALAFLRRTWADA